MSSRAAMQAGAGGIKSLAPLGVSTAGVGRADFFLMTQIFDLFGEPVPSNWGGRGRPEHVPTQQNRNRVSMLVALGWSNKRIADALYVTLWKHYFSALKFCEVLRRAATAPVNLRRMKEASHDRAVGFCDLASPPGRVFGVECDGAPI